jgi:hypothetical protein
MILIRTDLILLMPFFLAYLWVIKAFDRRLISASALSTAALYLIVNRVCGNYGWATVFDYTMFNISTHPADYPHIVTTRSYLSALISGIMTMAKDYLFLTYLTMLFAGSVALCQKANWSLRDLSCRQKDMAFLCVSSASYITIHFILFPVIYSRFFSAYYGLVMALVVSLLLNKNEKGPLS